MDEQTKVPATVSPFDKFDRDRADKIAITGPSGGIAFADMMQVMEFAKLMAISGPAVPRDLRNNAGMCLAVITQAIEWKMSPFQVAQKSYVVNDRLAFESQLIHAIVEARAPIIERLDCEYEGEGIDRRCTVIGNFVGPRNKPVRRTYTSPKIKDIKVKNSPLWQADPDQQLFYYSSRAWARKWCPDVILGIYAGDELREDPNLGREQEAGLHARLVGSSVDKNEGHDDEKIEQALKGIDGDDDVVDIDPQTAEEEQLEEEARKPKGKRGKQKKEKEQPRTTSLTKPSDMPSKEAVKAAADRAEERSAKSKKGKEDIEEKETPSVSVEPRNAKQWAAYCQTWIKELKSYKDIRERWDEERQLRNKCGVTSEERVPVQNAMLDRCKKLGEP